MTVAGRPSTLRRARRASAASSCAAGSGGVGKTTTAAVLALEAARPGAGPCVVTIDPAKRLADALGLEGLTQHADAGSTATGPASCGR